MRLTAAEYFRISFCLYILCTLITSVLQNVIHGLFRLHRALWLRLWEFQQIAHLP